MTIKPRPWSNMIPGTPCKATQNITTARRPRATLLRSQLSSKSPASSSSYASDCASDPASDTPFSGEPASSACNPRLWFASWSCWIIASLWSFLLSSEKPTVFELVVGLLISSSTSPLHGLHSFTISPHRRQTHPSPSSASRRPARHTKQYMQPHGIVSYGLVISVCADPMTPPEAPEAATISASDVNVEFWSW